MNVPESKHADRTGAGGDVDKALKQIPGTTSLQKEPKAILEQSEKEKVAENSGEACSSVPTEEKPPEDPQLLMQYMIDMDAYQKEEENATLTRGQVEDNTLDVDSTMHVEGPKMDDYKQPTKEMLDTEKMDATESLSKMESSQQEHETGQSEAEHLVKEPQPGPAECKDSAVQPEDEGSDKAAKNEPSIVEGSDQKSSEDANDSKKVTNQEKGRALDIPKNIWVSGLSSITRATDLKNLFSKYGKVICAKVVTDARNPGARCYGFITMLTPEEATRSIDALNQTELNGQTITVELAKSEPGCKKRTEQKVGSVKKVSKQSSNRRSGSDGDQSRDKSSINGKNDDRKDSQGDSKIQDDDRRKDRRERNSSRQRSHSRSRSSARRRDRERRRTRSRSQHRRSRSRDGGRDYISFDKMIALRERDRHWDYKRDDWEVERHSGGREVSMRESRREREGREMLARERVRLQIERMRLERERLEREALERERLFIEGERRREQERIRREKEELCREIRYEQSLKRRYDDSHC
ncbi:scaffold attachment factor B1-like isoform X3 [Chiloscyllium plagiosum]|uniref:scaffold attachment factor B1-like isoform X3 n=1 Tax=Chiloscyllium plagiosum TaxID=36176 RepID=UPI001CB84FA1|nr:scaffold attachment factor B1-like isoform X3 [Chiloscyllium plagiosum]